MKTPSVLPKVVVQWMVVLATSLAAVFMATPVLRAAGPTGSVGYMPLNNPPNIFDGPMGLVASYPLAVTSPANYPAGTSTAVTFQVTATGLTPLTAISDITVTLDPAFAGQATAFTQPGQTIHYIVTGNFPIVTLLPGIQSLAYSFTVQTVGWPMALGTYDNAGHFISATSTVPPPPPDAAPTVVISTPADGTSTTFAYSSLPATIPLAFTATASGVSPVSSVTADIFNPDGTSTHLTVTPSGLGTLNATGTATIPVTQPGIYRVRAQASNVVGAGEDDNNFTIVVTAPPPTVTIGVPVDGASITYNLGTTPPNVPVTFVGTSSFGGVRSMDATLDGSPFTFAVTGIGTLSATGTATIPGASLTAGSHTLIVNAHDDYGDASDSATFTINIVSPTPVVKITAPANGAVITHTTGTPAVNVPFTFTTTTTAGFTVDAVSLTLDNNSVSGITTPGLGTLAATTSTGTLNAVAAGTHTLVATGISAGISVTNSITFTVKESQPVPPPPGVVINQPLANSTYSLVQCGSGVSVPFSFTGLSSSGGISALTASLDGKPVTFTSTGIGTLTAVGSGTMLVTTAGTHTFSVTATDPQGNASASVSFVVTVVTPKLTVVISNPLNGSTITRVSSSGGCSFNWGCRDDDDDDNHDCGTSVPFAFTATETNGTVTYLSAKLNGCSVSVTPSGLNTGTATGIGTFTVRSAGTYTFVATAKGTGGLVTTTSSKFTVVVTAPPPTVTYKASWISPSSTSGSCTSIRGGSAVTVSFQILKSTGSYGCNSSTAYKDTTAIVSIYEILSNGATGTPVTYTYTSGSLTSSKYTIDCKYRYALNFPSAIGTHRYHIDVDIFPAGSSTPLLVGTRDFYTK